MGNSPLRFVSVLRFAAVVVLVLALLLVPPLARDQGTVNADPGPVVVVPGQGIELSQVDFLFDSATQYDSDWGRVSADGDVLLSSTGIAPGYLNIYTDTGWPVQNLFVHAPTGPVCTYFSLGLGAPQDVTSLSAYVEFSEVPSASFGDGPRSDFAVGATGYNAEGVGDPVTAVGAAVPANHLSFFEFQYQWCMARPYVNVQCADSQCFPMSIANSLEYLRNVNPSLLPITQPHVPGEFGDGSLVGEMDKYSGRQGTRVNGTGVWFSDMLRGKFQYLKDNGLNLLHEHQGRGYGQLLPDGDFSYAGITSNDAGNRVTREWLHLQICRGADVEIVWPGHAVRVVACGVVLNQYYIVYVHDALQTSQGDPTDTRGLEQVQEPVADFDGDGILEVGWDRDITFAMAESFFPPPGCFIATAAYGSPMAKELDTFRAFRDQYLETNPVGSRLVRLYYRYSPPVASLIDDHPALKPVARVILTPPLVMAKLALNTTMSQKVAVVGSMALIGMLLAYWLRKRQLVE